MNRYRRKNFFDQLNEQLDVGITVRALILAIITVAIITIAISQR